MRDWYTAWLMAAQRRADLLQRNWSVWQAVPGPSGSPTWMAAALRSRARRGQLWHPQSSGHLLGAEQRSNLGEPSGISSAEGGSNATGGLYLARPGDGLFGLGIHVPGSSASRSIRSRRS